MNLALAHSRARVGVHAPAVRVEVHLGGGLPNFTLVGLPAAAVRESRERVRAALVNAQFEFPQRRITVNLAPADLPKEGGRYDLAIALALLAASGQLPVDALGGVEVLGELALTGELKPVDGVLPAALAAARAGRPLVVPAGNGAEAALAAGVEAFTARTLLEVCAHLRGEARLPRADAGDIVEQAPRYPDLADVRGQAAARRALEVAAAGAHHLLLVGPPGCGKTLLASRLPGLLPPPDEAEALETAAVHSVSGEGLDLSRWRQRPFRAPHHLASAVAISGCRIPKCTRAHRRQRDWINPQGVSVARVRVSGTSDPWRCRRRPHSGRTRVAAPGGLEPIEHSKSQPNPASALDAKQLGSQLQSFGRRSPDVRSLSIWFSRMAVPKRWPSKRLPLDGRFKQVYAGFETHRAPHKPSVTA